MTCHSIENIPPKQSKHVGISSSFLVVKSSRNITPMEAYAINTRENSKLMKGKLRTKEKLY